MDSELQLKVMKWAGWGKKEINQKDSALSYATERQCGTVVKKNQDLQSHSNVDLRAGSSFISSVSLDNLYPL